VAELGVPGISSQYDQYIERLVDLAKVQRKPLEDRLEQSRLRRTVWTDLNNRLLKLQEAGGRLYGMNNVFRERVATSSNEQVAIVRPKRDVEPVDMKLQVRQIAAADRFSSAPVSRDLQIESGLYQFSVGEEQINLQFAGGNLADFSAALSAVNPELLRSSLVQSHAQEQTLFLESRVIGAQNGIDFKGKAKELAFSLGLITDQVDLLLRVAADNRSVSATGRVYEPKQEFLLNSGRTLDLTVETADDRIVEGAMLTIAYNTNERPRPSVAFLPDANPVRVDQALQEGRISPLPPDAIPYDLPVFRPDDNIYLRINDQLVSLASLATGNGDGQTLEISLDQFAGQRLQGIVLNNQDGMRDITISSLELAFPTLSDWTAVNAVSRAQDAEFTLDGVAVSRDVNVIEDLVPGQTIELRSASEESVDLSVKHDVKQATLAIEEFLFRYNWVVTQINFATTLKGNDAIMETGYYTMEEELERAKEIIGLMQGDQQLNGLKSRMQAQMTAAYPVGIEGESRYVLGNMGIGTKALTNTASSAGDRLGYFNVHDRGRFDQALGTQWDDVRDFFARAPELQGVYETGLIRGRMVNPNTTPTTADAEPSPFLATGLSATTESYTQTPRGVISNRSNQLESEIRRQTEALDAFDEDLERKRQQWIRDFAAAENAQREMERLQSQIEGMNRSQGGR
jgi:flagellar hook-associated protein 2